MGSGRTRLTRTQRPCAGAPPPASWPLLERGPAPPLRTCRGLLLPQPANRDYIRATGACEVSEDATILGDGGHRGVVKKANEISVTRLSSAPGD